jgi:hypothetical protein
MASPRFNVRRVSGAVAVGVVLALIAPLGHAANPVAVVDFADQWTKVAAVGPLLQKLKIPYDDLTPEVEKGSLKLAGQRILFLGSMVTNNPTLHTNLDKNADAIQAFAKGGGAVIEPTQADQNEANVDWLPPGLKCVRSDPDSPDFKIEKPKHLMFNAPNKLTDDDFKAWGHQGWPTVWEVLAVLEGFDLLASSQNRPVIGEATFGSGRFVMLSIAPDKYALAGNDDRTKEKAALFFENLVNTYLPTDVSPRGRLATTWAAIRQR